MLNPLIDTRDVKFVVFELLEVDKMTKYPAFAILIMTHLMQQLTLQSRWLLKLFFPLLKRVIKSVLNGIRLQKKLKFLSFSNLLLTSIMKRGFMGLTDHPEDGGMGMPNLIGAAASEFVCAANYCLGMYPGLSHGCMEILFTHATEEQKRMYARQDNVRRMGRHNVSYRA